MTNKELQDYLKLFPDDAEIWEEYDGMYAPARRTGSGLAYGTNTKEERRSEEFESWYSDEIEWADEDEEMEASRITIICI